MIFIQAKLLRIECMRREAHYKLRPNMLLSNPNLVFLFYKVNGKM
jgi:hypothetical protein